MFSNRRGLAALTLLGGVALGAALGAGITLAATDRESGTTPHIHDDVTTHGEWVKYTNASGDSVRAYVAYPERSDKAPVVIVIHEIFGLTAWEPTVADSFAKKGYIAISPDLLSSRWKMSPATDDSGRKLMALLTTDGVNADLDATYKYATTRPAANAAKVGVIGFCWGGGTVWKYAAANPNLQAAVVCYGPAPDSATLVRIKTPVLGVYGQNDARVTATLPTVARTLAGIRLPFVADSYLGTGHGFLKPGRTGYGSLEAARAMKNVDAFFAKYLGK